MRSSAQHYGLFATLLIVHVSLLLPLLLTRTIEEQWPTIGSLHAELAIPLGIAAFAAVYMVRWLASGAQLPRNRAQRAPSSGVEASWAVLLGVFEELLRWGLVRLLIWLEGGGGGYGGTSSGLLGFNVTSEPEYRVLGAINGLWRGVYLMCWTWSLIESIVLSVSFWVEARAQTLLVTQRRRSSRTRSDAGSFSYTFPTRTRHRYSTSSRSSIGLPRSFFTDLFIRKKPFALSASVSSISDDGTRVESVAGDHLSSDGDDEGSLSDSDTDCTSPSQPLLEDHGSQSSSTHAAPDGQIHAFFPFSWRVSSLLSQIGYGLVGSWFPTLIFSSPCRPRPGLILSFCTYHLEYFTLVVLLLLCIIRGFSTAFWRSAAARLGLINLSLAALVAAVLVYMIGLALWGVIEPPWSDD